MLLTRPLAQSQRLAARLGRQGIETLIEPMLEIRACDTPRPSWRAVQGVLVTSANALRWAPANLLRSLARARIPVHCVGPASEEARRAAKLAPGLVGTKDAAALGRILTLRLNPEDGGLVHLCATQRAHDFHELSEVGFRVALLPVYEAVPARRLSAATRTALRRGDIDAALFFSPRTALSFVKLVEKSGLADSCAGIAAYCLSPAVAAALDGVRWRALRVCAAPSEERLLALFDSDGL